MDCGRPECKYTFSYLNPEFRVNNTRMPRLCSVLPEAKNLERLVFPNIAFSFKLMTLKQCIKIFIQFLLLFFVAHQFIACRLIAKPSALSPNTSFMCIVLLVLWTL